MTALPLRSFTYAPPDGPIQILYEDDDFIIIDKPAGLLSVAGKADSHKDCLEARIQIVRPQARIIHRLDMSTSGVMVLAKNSHAHRHIGLQFEKRQTSKTYIAHVWGQLQKDTGHIDLPLICDWPNRPLQKVDFENGKSAQTNWEVIRRSTKSTYLRLLPITGRSHQLRVHMHSLDHPILGDRLYAHQAAYMAADRLMLHAETLSFRHPNGGAPVNYCAPSPL